MKQKIKITIGIPTYNEERTIRQIIETLLKQCGKKFIIESILVVSDGSTDKTNEIVASFNTSRVKLIKGKKRSGKNSRLNYIFKNSSSDLLIVLDADVEIRDLFLIDKIVDTFLLTKVSVLAGNVIPLPPKTFIERGINNYVHALTEAKNSHNYGNNIYSMRGPLYALSREFYKNFSLPNNVPDDRYIYLSAKKNGYAFIFCPRAIVYFRSPQTVYDQMLQGKRFLVDKQNLSEHFSDKLMHDEYSLPFFAKVKIFLYQVRSDILSYLVLKGIHFYISRVKTASSPIVWEKVRSTKQV